MAAPRGMRPVIIFVGRRNVGKSALFNALTGQQKSIVADTAGTTTDPVPLAFELLPFGAVTLYDSAGLDDEGSLGQARIKATEKIMASADLKVLVVDAQEGLGAWEKSLLKKQIAQAEVKNKWAVIFTKTDQGKVAQEDTASLTAQGISWATVNIFDPASCANARTFLAKHLSEQTSEKFSLLQDLGPAGAKVILVVPIDASAPVGRLILPQVQVLRELLDRHAFTLTVRPEELAKAIKTFPPDLVITDSQAVAIVAKTLPSAVKWTTFSILMAAAKGDLKPMQEALTKIDQLADGATILIAEACAHHQMGDDIARVKIPQALTKYTQKAFNFKFARGGDFPEDLAGIDLVIHCGGCMLPAAAMQARITRGQEQGVAITNFGLVLTKVLAQQHPGLVFPSPKR